ncbi:hypothetical protein GRF29_1g2753902 [Pseudopithomyces chartarum]|uniref:Uncharacterized protein n=1 Tax=Pseudopithomyces chartarum TaxID=1892770 RepID=A0AAN6RNA9_9PLEO|nr:hypothetical protein GRF29_1g2753902 [Pseudopithomyces chartarum]
MSPNRVTKPGSPTRNKIARPRTHSQVRQVTEEFLAQFAESKVAQEASPPRTMTRHLETPVKPSKSVRTRSGAPKTAIPRETAKAGSSKPLSVPLRRLLSAINGLKNRIATYDDKLVSAGSLLKCLHNWENVALKIVQDFEEAEEQRIVDIKNAIDADQRRDQRREQLHAEQLKVKDAELAVTVESLMELVSNGDSHIIDAHASFKRKMAAVKVEHEERLAEELEKQKEESKIQLQSQAEAIAALKQENEEMSKKLADLQAVELSPTQQQQLFDLVASSFQPCRAVRTQEQCLPVPQMASATGSAPKKAPVPVQVAGEKRKRTTDDKNPESVDSTPRKSPRVEHVQDSTS